jgi:single-stranded-DNA-specific exonuclease
MKVKTPIEISNEVDKELSRYSPLIKRLLVNRGIVTAKGAQDFIEPSYDLHTFDPFEMKGVTEAVARIYKAVNSDEKMVVYADYDCDGIPAGTILADFFDKLSYENYEVYIPDRHKEGYGLKKEALQIMADDGVKLLMTVDLGITNVEEVAFAKSLGMDVILTDHHLCPEVLPAADIIVNPKQIDCNYPDNMLCGSGVAFKIVQAFVKTHGKEFGVHEGWEKWLLDLVGLATLSDMVPLVNENRVFAYYGMKVLQKTRRHGFVELFNKNRLKPRFLVEDDITFTISPRLNAAGRMDHPRRAFELLSAKTAETARELADYLESLNNTRKKITASTSKHAKAKVRAQAQTDVIVTGDPSWSVGILGLVASKLVEEFGKPAFVWGGDEDSDILKGSCRGNGSAHLVDMMKAAGEEAFLGFGGHAEAGGFSMTKEQVHKLGERLNNAYKEVKVENGDSDGIRIDGELSLDDLNDQNVRELRRLAPYGMGNPKPTFLFKGLVLKSMKEFGKAGTHVELTFENSIGMPVKVIQFFKSLDDIAVDLSAGDVLDIVGVMEKSFFGRTVEIRIRADYIEKK